MNIKDKMNQIPFGSSIFQIVNFTANQESDERSYRHILLQLDSKNKAMKECYFRRKRIEIDLKEIEEKLLKATGFEKERLEIDQEEKEFSLNEEIKLIEDCIVEIKAYEYLLSKMPEFTREDFENSEYNYWEKRLINQANMEINTSGNISLGVMESLRKIGCNLKRDENGSILVLKSTQLKDNNKITKSILEYREEK